MTPLKLFKREPVRVLRVDRYEFRFYREVHFDSRRVWVLAGLFRKHDGHPIAILQRAGREGDDFCQDLVIDAVLHRVFRNRFSHWCRKFYYGRYHYWEDKEIVSIRIDKDYSSNTHGNLVTEFATLSLDGHVDDSGWV